ncbi:Hypothetical predicted protein [Pelobates cultripes]|uniref:Uncharacterized protein n=1 Tax=Pelobates cultripes TaxID=61616 RepID=A0AAD1W2W7_PELCU|nr:Hypothetical predicted protein [Pelobates cultripes]
MAETAHHSPKIWCMKAAHPTYTATNADQQQQLIRHPQSPATRTHPGTLTGHLPRVTLLKLPAPVKGWTSNWRQEKGHSKPSQRSPKLQGPSAIILQHATLQTHRGPGSMSRMLHITTGLSCSTCEPASQ